jgi:tellurite resistance protein TerA
MPDLTMGANAPITEDCDDLILEWPGAAGSLDCSAFLLGSNGRVRSDEDMVFYNQREGGDGAVRLVSHDTPGHSRFAFDLRRVPENIERIVVCATVDGGGCTIEAFSGLRASFGGTPTAIRFAPDLRGAKEVALRIVEVYRRGNGWKLRADGQGYNAGLGQLAESFGVDVEGGGGEASAVPPPTNDVRASERPQQSTVDPEQPLVFDVPPLNDIGAAKPTTRPLGTTVLHQGELRKLVPLGGDAGGVIKAVLSWSSRQGGAEGRARPLRLRLGAFYELNDGRRGALQEPDALQAPVGDAFLVLAPSGHEERNETAIIMQVGRIPQVVRMQLYAFIEGPPSWRSSQVELLVTVPGHAAVAIEVPTMEDGCSCALLAALRSDGGGLTLECLVRAAFDQRTLDAELGWNLRWRSPSRL